MTGRSSPVKCWEDEPSRQWDTWHPETVKSMICPMIRRKDSGLLVKNRGERDSR